MEKYMKLTTIKRNNYLFEYSPYELIEDTTNPSITYKKYLEPPITYEGDISSNAIGELVIYTDWYDDEYSEKDKNKYMWGDGQHFIGVFGVNPAVDEFCKENNIEFSLTEEFSRTWYFEK